MKCKNCEKSEKQIEILKKELICKDEKLNKRREQAQRDFKTIDSLKKKGRLPRRKTSNHHIFTNEEVYKKLLSIYKPRTADEYENIKIKAKLIHENLIPKVVIGYKKHQKLHKLEGKKNEI